MKIGPKYKIARRLGAPIFEKTQNQKFTLRGERKKQRRRRPRTDYGLQLIEKQKVRYFYCITEKQFSNYVKKSITNKKSKPVQNLFGVLERRVDSVVLRLGLAPSRLAARQMVSHGHITVNGRKITIPSYHLSIGDIVGIREGSRRKKIFEEIEENQKNITMPVWINYDSKKKEATLKSGPVFDQGNLMFNLNQVIEFYSR